MVCIFCILSAFFVCLSMLDSEDLGKIIMMFPKRYLRIVVPIIPMAISVYILSKYNLFYNIECAAITRSEWLSQFYKVPLSIKQTILHAFYNAPILGDMSINAVLWMMPYILLGSIIPIIIGANYMKSPYVTYLIIVILFIHYNGELYLCAVIGSALAIFYTKTENIRISKIISFISVILLGIGILFAVYPNSIIILLNNRFSYWQINMFGSILFIIGVMYSSFFQKLFSLKAFVYLGKISFSIYIIHLPVICSISSFCFIKMINYGVGYLQAMFITLIITFAIVLCLSSMYYRYVEINCNKLIKRIFKF